MSFDPNGVGVANGNIFGFPVEEASADIVIIPIPWDVTASYKKGTSAGPKAILNASTQLDFFHPKVSKAYETKVFMTPISEEWMAINNRLNMEAAPYFSALETEGEEKASADYIQVINAINDAQHALSSNLEERTLSLIHSGKICGVLGGEHSTPLGLIKALDKTYGSFSVLQIDAHADLRNAYEGFTQSHASIMYNVLHECPGVEHLVQVGIRDLSDEEFQLTQHDARIKSFFDWELNEARFLGKSWDDQCQEIINALTENVYISFDIDGLRPELCPNTGTPVPGGFSLEEVAYLLFKVVDSGKKIIGFDLNEVAPGPSGDWDANVGARALWELINAAELSRRQHAG